jgi:hypothetical protein
MSNKKKRGCPHGVAPGECAICDLGDDPVKYGYAAGAAGRAGKIDSSKPPPKRAATLARIGTRKPPKRAEPKGQKTYPGIMPVLRLPIRTLACSHPRNQVCQHCVEGVAARVMYREALNRNPRILRLDAWRVSGDSQLRREAGMEGLKTTMAEIQKQMLLHTAYVCDGCVHCKENANV